MPEQEKRAWFELAVAGSAVAAWVLLYLLTRSSDGAMAAFALLAVTGLRRPDRLRCDERDEAIARSAISVAVRCWFVISVVGPIGAATYFGWDRSVSLRVLAQTAWMAWIVVLLVRSAATVVMYRSVRYA